jgi:1,2-diacylglycerol 3-alpha-glucosyltransferase
LGITENVDFVGFKTHVELNQLIAESMAMLIDTKQDLNIVSIPESIVSGTPIISNLVPLTAAMVNKYQLGIAINEWDESTLIEIIENNSFYVDKCISYRNKLSTKYLAQKLIGNFLNYTQNKNVDLKNYENSTR